MTSAPPVSSSAPRAFLGDIASRVIPCRGETRSGDVAVVRHDGDWTLFAVIDALGHGPNAADVADRAAHHLEHVPFAGRDVGEVVHELGEALRGTRGAAGLLCLWHGPSQELTGCGVGNVELRAVGTRVPALLSPGVLGAPIRRLHPFGAVLRAPTTLFVCSDGVSSRLALADLVAAHPDAAALCAAALAIGRKQQDDATVLVARFQERRS